MALPQLILSYGTEVFEVGVECGGGNAALLQPKSFGVEVFGDEVHGGDGMCLSHGTEISSWWY